MAVLYSSGRQFRFIIRSSARVQLRPRRSFSGRLNLDRLPAHLAHSLKDEYAVAVHPLRPSLQRGRQNRS